MASSGAGDGSGPSKNDIPRGLINRSGSTPGRGGRLPSVKGARDLTLGGVQRKVFTPNLAALKKPKTKDDAKPAVPSASPSPKSGETGKGRGKDSRGRGRGRGQREDRTIQLQSEFSHGPMGGSRSSGWGGGGGGGGGGGRSGGGGSSREVESDALAMKAIRRNEDTEEDKKMLDSLLRDDFISDLSCGDPMMAPINLPLHANLSKIKLEEKVDIKEEVMDTDEPEPTSSQIQTTLPTLTTKSQIPISPKTVKDILDLHSKSDQGELILLQFPDTLPGLPTFDAEDDKPKDTTTKNKEQELPNLGMCQLKDCHEGFMGKIRIRKSGKTELVLGDNVMDIMPGIPINFHQELVSIHTDNNPGQMVVLGPVEHKLLLSPNYKNLLENT